MNKEIDVRPLAMSEKHPAVFKMFDGIKVGDSFTLIVNHDPIALKHQFAEFRANQFSWTYESKEKGLVKIKIARLSDGPATEIGQLGCCGKHD